MSYGVYAVHNEAQVIKASPHTDTDCAADIMNLPRNDWLYISVIIIRRLSVSDDSHQTQAEKENGSFIWKQHVPD